MRKIIVKIISFFSKDNTAKYIVVISAFLIAFAVLLYLAATDVVSNVFGTVTGFMLSSMFLYSCKIVIGRMEDMLKVNYDTEALLQLYSGAKTYRKTLELGKTSVDFAYAPLLLNRDYEFHVVDEPEKMMELDEFISGNFQTIFQAHSNSSKGNRTTVRLDRYDPQTHTFYLSRSTYYNHLVTNRAIDFLIFDDVSLRSIYEYGPRLTPLEESKMSNHVGINALVFLSDGNLLVPRRSNSSTISKNKVTSSIAVPLNLPAEPEIEGRKEGKDKFESEIEADHEPVTIDVDYLLRDNVLQNLFERVKLPKDAISEKDWRQDVEIEFLGFGQNIYEGGKPQFYFCVKLKNIDTEEYFAKRKQYLEEKKKKSKGKKKELDSDKCIYAVRYDSFELCKGRVKFTACKNAKETFTVKCGYEMSYLCNLWHYEASKTMKRKAAEEKVECAV